MRRTKEGIGGGEGRGGGEREIGEERGTERIKQRTKMWCKRRRRWKRRMSRGGRGEDGGDKR